MHYRLLSDSSCDIRTLDGADFTLVPLHIITSEQDYTDDAALDTDAMADALRRYRGRTSTSCPSPADWEAAFGSAEGVDGIFVVTITGALSGSYNAACAAAARFMEQNPGCPVHVIDSRSTGPEPVLLLEKLRALTGRDLPFGQIVADITDYAQHTALVFILSSVQNLAKNGRASRLQAEAVGLLGIRIVGQASPEGTLDVIGKYRGEEAARIKAILHMKKQGWSGGRAVIAHCRNESGARMMRGALCEICPDTEVTVLRTGGLCSFYAEEGGLLIGYERA